MERLLKTQDDINEFIFWVVCLQEEVLPQGYGCLQDCIDGYCCLGVGVACLVENPSIYNHTRLNGEFPTLNSPLWLQAINHDYGRRTGTNLSILNDNNRETHKQIGDSLLEVYKDQLTL